MALHLLGVEYTNFTRSSFFVIMVVVFQTQVVALDLKENCTETNTHEVVSVINEMENIVDVIDSLVSNCETQTAYASVHSDSTSSITKMPATKNVAESLKENHHCKFDATTLETVVELELEDKSIQETNKKLLNDLIGSIVVEESEKVSVQELLDNLIELVVTEKSLLEINKKLLNNLIESVVIRESEKISLQETNKEFFKNHNEVHLMDSKENPLQKTNGELLNVESVNVMNSKEKSKKKDKVIFQTKVGALDLKENYTEANTHEVVSVINEMENIVDVIDSLVSNCETQTAYASVHSDSTSSITKMPATKNVAESLKENHHCKFDATTLETVVELELEDKSIQETNKKLLNDLIGSIVVEESEKVSVQELLDNLIELVVTEKSLLEINKKLLNNLIESVVIRESEKISLQETNKEFFKNHNEVHLMDSKENPLQKTNGELLNVESVNVMNSKEKSKKKDKLGIQSCLLHCDSDSDFSDTPQNEVTNFSEDSMLSECSYECDSCQSSHSLCYSTESLGLDVPSESQTALQKDSECTHPSSSSPPKSFSELNVNTTLCVPETRSNQSSFEGFISKIDGNSVIAEELECSEALDPIPDIQDKSFAESDIINGEDMNLNQSHSLSIPQTSKDDVQCDYFEEEHNHVPNLLPCASTPLQTINESTASSNDSSVSTQDDIHVLESDNSKEPKSSNLLHELLNPKPSKTTKVTSNSGKLCNPIEISDEIDENTDALSAESEQDLSHGEKKDYLPFENESNILSAVNTISWNPNHGCHLWLFTAGNSGIARLTCVSELIKKENTSVSSQESNM
ncbi:general transcription factor 3C polypeptide 2 [Trichonephila clavipes]|nr:general transcription factor 3C polypeptide 2 [Trichonephila clavipes]